MLSLAGKPCEVETQDNEDQARKEEGGDMALFLYMVFKTRVKTVGKHSVP